MGTLRRKEEAANLVAPRPRTPIDVLIEANAGDAPEYQARRDGGLRLLAPHPPAATVAARATQWAPA